MKKIMFNDRYGLTQAVIEGRKTMTRRLADPKQKYQNLKRWQPCLELDFGLYGLIEDDGWESIEPKYNLGEIVAVAQNYSSFYNILDKTRPIPEGAGWDSPPDYRRRNRSIPPLHAVVGEGAYRRGASLCMG